MLLPLDLKRQPQHIGSYYRLLKEYNIRDIYVGTKPKG